MKTRTDFVSNSSSSSFILQDCGFFKMFGITKEDIYNALIDLYGREAYAKQLEEQTKHCCVELVNYDLKSREEQKLGLSKKYYKDKLKKLKSGCLDIWCIYDMTNEVERNRCFKEWDKHFEEWYAPNIGEYDEWMNVVAILRWKCQIDNVDEVANGSANMLKVWKPSRSRHPGPVAYHKIDGAELIKHVKSSLRVKTMKDLLHESSTTLMLHFDDNVVHNIKGMSEPGKADMQYAYSNSKKATAANALWDSKSYSADRFFEILIKHFVKIGKVDLHDSKLLDFFRSNVVVDTAGPCKDVDVSWRDIYAHMLNASAVMHEG